MVGCCRRRIGKKDADGQVRQCRDVQLHGIAYRHRSGRYCCGWEFAKCQNPVGARIYLRPVDAPRDVCAADDQWLVAKSVGDLDPNSLSARARVHDQTQSLIAEPLRLTGHGRLRCGPPGPDPMPRVAALGGTRCRPRGIDSAEQGKRCDANQRANPSSHSNKFNQRILVSSILHLPALVSVLRPSSPGSAHEGASADVNQVPTSLHEALPWVPLKSGTHSESSVMRARPWGLAAGWTKFKRWPAGYSSRVGTAECGRSSRRSSLRKDSRRETVSTACSRSRAMLVFTTYPVAPARNEAATMCGES